MNPQHLHALTKWITEAAVETPNQLDSVLASRLGVQSRAARRTLAQLVELGWLVCEGGARQRVYRPGLLRQVARRYALEGLTEDLPWDRDFAPYFTLPPTVLRMVQHSFCELLNNAIEHSGGSHVTVSVRQTANQAQLLMSDNGRGLFRQIADVFAIDSAPQAMLELSKGKLTSQPATHSGQGLFFTSRLADVFDLHANASAFQQRSWDAHRWHPRPALAHEGTSVYAAFALDTERTLDSVRREYSGDGLGMRFERTVVPLRLITSAAVGLESRAQARRIGARLTEFCRVELDFGGIATVGHAFADELFRVLPTLQPALRLVPMNMSPDVAAMVDSLRPLH